MRALGIDWGEKRVGVALSDSGETLATPYETVEHANDEVTVIESLRRLIDESGAEIIVLGEPRSLSGAESSGSSAMNERAKRLKDALGIEVELIDERLTSVSAHQSLQASGLNEKKRRDKVDQVAAAILLQAWLDSRSS